MTSEELLSAMLQEDPDNEEENMDDELPSKASDVPLSRNGSLHLFCASLASYTLFDSPVKPPTPSLYPEFSMMLSKILGPSASSTLGQENVVSLDALLFLGCYIVKSTQTVDPTGNPEIRDILQRLALLSANIPSAALRYQAHLLTSTILHRYLLPDVRLAFIKDTLEHCPYENLKASAVGWLKDEILNAQKLISDVSRGNTGTADVSVFATREILLTIGPLLLVDASILVKSDLKSAFGIDTPPLQRFQAYAAFEQFQPFVLAVLNLIFLLLSSPGIFSCLEIKSIGPAFDMIRYCDRMRAASLLFQGWLAEEDTKNRESSKSPAQVDAEKQARRAKMLLLDQTIDRVMEAAGAAGLP